jgi:hypothetical protein
MHAFMQGEGTLGYKSTDGLRGTTKSPVSFLERVREEELTQNAAFDVLK